MEKLIFLLLLLTIVLTSCTTSTEPKAPGEIVDDLLNTHALEKENAQLFIRAFKYEEELECWGKAKGATTWKLLKTYPICRNSGTLGPKRKEGDRQVPEGVYSIDRFNPNSNFHLSLGLNYPNESDRIRGDRIAPGSDIFIHGACITVGCIPLTDPLIEEVFLMAEMARDAGQKHIPVHIFPGRMDAKRFLRRMETSDHESFWQELLPVFTSFETTRQLPTVRVDDAGRYIVVGQ